MEIQQPQPSKQPTKGYGKRPVWQWVLLYVILAIIFYGLFYLAFIHKAGVTTGY
jgi:hypothetical protein